MKKNLRSQNNIRRTTMRLRLGARHDSPGERTADDGAGWNRWHGYTGQRLLPEATRALDTEELEQNRSHRLATGLTRRRRRLLLSSIQRLRVLHIWILNRRAGSNNGELLLEPSMLAAYFFCARSRAIAIDFSTPLRVRADVSRSDRLGI